MVLKLYSAPLVGPAGNAGIVALVLAEKQIPFEDIPLDFKVKEHKQPKHLARHPFGLVPVVDDNGFVLYEMRAICRYLAEKYPEKGPRLLPGPSIEERAIFEQAASVEVSNFQVPVAQIFRATIRRGFAGLPIDCAELEAGIMNLVERLEVYEQILSRQRITTWSAQELTIVDLFHLSPMDALVTKGIVGDAMTCEARPNVSRWWKEISTRPEWVKLRAEGIRSCPWAE
ncbi:hypothetical protein HMN09_01298500 [Mycena chlorophos]|uniref:glutathione transferase n=1 Tax=Mycena chlorophos TaxID=658473 RepID=A0A8H6RZ61_MYCCL|nr:hypothetical protein HMN09_01298500 [Mycena chlorophos]